jgi:hypothetical protein
MLGEQDLANGNLDGYDAIIIGIRATAVRDDLKAYSKRLLEYCERGGNLVYQYQTQEFDAAPYGPYPYRLGARAEEVSEEDSKVTILDAANPVFNWPNKITETDFNGWVEERGSKVDEHVGRALQAAARIATTVSKRRKRRDDVRAVRQGNVRLCGLCVLSAVASGCARRLQAVCECHQLEKTAALNARNAVQTCASVVQSRAQSSFNTDLVQI